ncbi:hypothetical protein GOBAR_DD07396 [Gossypium barbadense]|nr:hypothetical protein GOBAR_DD07396 [Gossypium barbadense]
MWRRSGKYSTYNWEWLTWLFKRSSIYQCHLFCCALWVIWTKRSKKLHEAKSSTGKGIAEMTNRFLREIDEVGNGSLTKQWVVSEWRPPETQVVKINFGATYDCNQLGSTSGLVARNGEGKVLASK